MRAPARSVRNDRQELDGQGFDEVGRIPGFRQRPFDAVAQVRLLVDVETLSARENLDAPEDGVVRLAQLLGCFLPRGFHLGRRNPLGQIGDDRIGESSTSLTLNQPPNIELARKKRSTIIA